MKIKKNLNGTALEMVISGRIDTITSPTLETSIFESIDGITEITLDFAEVEYISSAGLRVLMATQKTMSEQGELKVKNVSDDVMEIFEFTGFTDILTIE